MYVARRPIVNAAGMPGMPLGPGGMPIEASSAGAGPPRAQANAATLERCTHVRAAARGAQAPVNAPPGS